MFALAGPLRPFDLMGALTLLDGSCNSSDVRGLSQFDMLKIMASKFLTVVPEVTDQFTF